MKPLAPEGRAARVGRAALLLSTALIATLVAQPLAAQGARGTATTNVRYITIRPIERDTVPRTAVTEVDGVLTFDGIPVHCVGDGSICTFYRAGDVAHGVIATQDVSATAWGLGVQGLSVTTMLRARARLDGDFAWPQADNPFDAILAYAEYQRSFYRVRAGRQRTLSGLGFSGFDGLELMAAPWPWLRAEAYGGRSLARGLHEPRHTALQAIEPFIFDQDADLLGAFVEARPAAGTTIGLRYQREIWRNRIGLISERAALDVRSALPGPLRMVRLDAAADWDVYFNRVGKAHLTVRALLPGDRGLVEVTGRRYLPYFETSTIWGFFSPSPYHEAEVRTTVRALEPVTAWASFGWRRYGDPEIDIIGPPISDQSRRAGLGARWAAGDFTAFGEYRAEWGFGAFLSSGDVEVRWQLLEPVALTAHATAFQQIEQFRVGDNRVVGGGFGVDARLPRGLRLRSGADLYLQNYDNRPGQPDWNQLRAHTIVTVPFGQDPGTRPWR